jgi:cytochrome P450
MTNPFEDDSGSYLVLVNDQGQRSLWPTALSVPDGWNVNFGPMSRRACLEHIDATWTDMRPKRLGQRSCPVAYPFREYTALELDPIYFDLHKHQQMLRVSMPYGDDAWLAASYDAVKFVMNDPRFSRDTKDYDEARLTPFPIRTSILGMDPPDHTRLKKALFAVLTFKQADGSRPWMTAICNQLIDGIIYRGSQAELITEYTLPFTGQVSCHLMGIPAEDRAQFKTWIDGFSSTSALPQAEVEFRMEAMYDYITKLVHKRRESPGDDIISQLLQPKDRSLRLSDIELVDLVTVLLLAGYDSTAMELGSAIFVLLIHTEQRERLRQHPELWPGALQELLRYIPLDSHVTFARYATEDVVVGNTLVRKGDAVLASFPSANRDPAVFDDPNTFNIERVQKPNFGLGSGLHKCAGMPLALAEMEIALSTLLDRLPTMRLAVPEDDLRWNPGTLLRSLSALPVEW